MIVVGVILLFVGSYALFLWYTGDIGSRPKLYANPVEFDFGKYRGFFWPIYNFELAKLLPMCMLFFCSLYVYVGQRDIKDSMVAFTIPLMSIVKDMIHIKLYVCMNF